jgi:pimeloyl-ACP methyl ester carboxylesterase
MRNGTRQRGKIGKFRCIFLLLYLCAICCCYTEAYVRQNCYAARQLYSRSELIHSIRSRIKFIFATPIKSLENEIENVKTTRSRNVQFISPLLEYGYLPAIEEHENQTLSTKPLLLYLPGFDGTCLSPFLQFPELHTIFDVRCMTVAVDDRSTLDDLQADVLQYLENECTNEPTLLFSAKNESKQSKNSTLRSVRAITARNASEPTLPNQQRRRPLFLAGESFGGILASMVSIKLVQEAPSSYCLKGLILINAATCYDRSKLAIEGPKVSQLHDFTYPFGLISRLLPLFIDKYSMAQLLLILQAKALPSVIDNSCREAYMGRVAFSLPFLLKFMPKETLQWRLSSWLDAGCAQLASADKPLEKLKNLRTLIIAGENDATLPSIAEAERLASILKNSVIHVVKGAGHASTCGSRVDLAALFRLRFEELRPNKYKERSNAFIFWQQPRNQTELELLGRTAMKQEATMWEGAYFGMQPRYDNAKIGLNPLRYWSAEYYRTL